MGEAPRLKPMSSTEILDGAFRLYRDNFATFLGILAIAYVPVVGLMMTAMGVLLADLQHLPPRPRGGELPPEVVVLMIIAGGGTLLLLLIAMPLATGALTRAVGARYLDEPISIGKAYRHIGSIFFKYLGTTMLSGLVIALGFPFCLVPGFMFMTWFFASSPVCVLEGLGGTAAMGRSRDLVRGHGWRVFGLLFLTMILQNVIAAPVNFGSDFVCKLIFRESLVLQSLVSTAVQQSFNMLITPFFSVVAVLLYYDLRIRKEAFDLEVLARNMGSAAPAKAAPAQP